MGAIKFPHASGNSMSIAAPATNPASDLELKLPATIGTADQVLKNGSTPGTLEFGDAGLTGVTTGSGNVTITDGNLIVASGHGVDFSATSDGPSMASELFDDYEEGTFDVTFNGNVSAQSGANKVQYVKVGRLVTLSGQVHLESSNNTDNVEVNNLPFASSSNLGESTGEQYVLGGDYELNHQSDTTGVRFYLTSASQVAKLIDMRDNAGYAQVPAAPSKYVFLSMTYICQT